MGLLAQIGKGLVGQNVVFEIGLKVEVMALSHIGVIGKEGLLSSSLLNNRECDEEGDRESSMQLTLPSNLAGGAALSRICFLMRLPHRYVFCKGRREGAGQTGWTALPLPGGRPSTSVTCSICRCRITILAMRFVGKTIAGLTLCGLAVGASFAQPQSQQNPSSDATRPVRHEKASRRPVRVALSPDDGLAVIAAALDARVKATRQRDCSHLVHAIYLRAGFPYPYASSSDLYDGADDFQRVTRPQPGDLVVWPGHVGIVVNPAQRVFFSRLRSGPGVDAYDADYWKERGQVRFYRYIKSSPAGVATTRLVR